nr:DUF2726 domain-containing protein [Candidatus Woesearchaeota archaeon]
INYVSQFTFKNLVYKKKLRFDFGLLDDKGNLFILIEYDGIQHYESNEFFGGIKEFKELKKRDSMKNKYCKDSGYKLIRIFYKDYHNIESILEKELAKIKLI